MSIVIGLTGGIATGKSTVAKMFDEEDIPVIDTDKIARDVVDKGKPAYEKIVHHFSDDILLCTGHINRKKLGKIVFKDREERETLNDIVHPEVRRVVEKQIRRNTLLDEDIIVVDVPLLFESGFDELVDYTLVVFTDTTTQLERLMSRDSIKKEDAEKRINSQMSIKEKIVMADYKIDNSMSILETKRQFKQIHNKLKKLCGDES
ncbi:dephospho-CoA kinase [Haloplasma contractile]|uniref:Dephospho-CoA kinase n=1 Tax=Haloplasma contractile SSD-17B TaxID=1033810 RepID=U2FEZ4_9MOLU|nr:dephospho-CoA kinase [Haloplasma contractile]ERJ11500.1 Dephospho-CoA kinase protein [Haloplasma contractile SSD-17B]